MMEDGVKGEVAKPDESKFVGKAGWVKKSSGKFLGSYKDRYILVDKTEIVVYEKEDLERCIERVDLEKYDRCCRVKGPFQKKNRLVLIPAPKSKVHDVKLQIPNPEEKDAWIKALSDAINRAKNKIFDEVKIDESSSLEHVTRTRPKGSRSRRPPTRIHMKEVASVSSDGILRLDLDTVDSTPNGTYPLIEEAEAPKEAVKPPMPPSKDSETQQQQQESSQEPNSETTVLKPPMPPSKDSKPTTSAMEPLMGNDQESTEESISIIPTLEKTRRLSEEKDVAPNVVPTASSKDLQPPTPPSKHIKPTLEKEVLESAEGTEEEKVEGLLSETVPGSSSEQTMTGDGCASESSAPLEPSVSDQEHLVLPTAEQEPTNVLEESAPSEKEKLVPSSTVTEHKEEQKLTAPPVLEVLESSSHVSKTPEQLVEPVRKNPGPPAPPKKKPLKPPVITGYICDLPTGSTDSSKLTNIPTLDDVAMPACETTATEAKTVTDSGNPVHTTEVTCANVADEAVLGTEIMIQSGEMVSAESSKGVVPSSDTVSATVHIASDNKDTPKSEEDTTVSPKLKSDTLMLVVSNFDTGDHLDLTVEQIDQEELRSSDSGQHSDDESETADNIRASTIALSGSRARLDEDIGEDGADFMDSHTLGLEHRSDNTVTQKHKTLHDPLDGDLLHWLSQSSPPLLALLPSLKRESRSVGDLLSCTKLVEELSPMFQSNDTGELCGTACPELNTDKFLHTLSGSMVDGGAPSEVSPQELLAEAVDRLRKADEVLREANRMKNCSRRLSW
ncbi:pleckstrin homology domain-containing family O member 2-like [Scleropages formosus]|uniref:Pleckstrin homology domain containing, family O member 2 n=1 Tax=Scleropages formosus TaxID=113540 RepID=A0A8C9S2T8_SCLFO|nr:pleckstrin homology domain-containing family O member 2-like [Scleropages formosus]XP_029109655.1 pleckstrin homology domain-containing family O member 2-like [Scleropages formosus]